MMKIRLLILTFFALSTGCVYSQVSLIEARNLYFQMDNDECNALVLSDKFKQSPPAGALLKAYYGAASAAAPACLNSPMSKLSSFRRGKQLLDEAVFQQPDNTEIRFLRFATQTKAPAFLGYNQNTGNDKQIIVKTIEHFSKKEENKTVAGHIARFMIASGELNTAEKAVFERLLK